MLPLTPYPHGYQLPSISCPKSSITVPPYPRRPFAHESTYASKAPAAIRDRGNVLCATVSGAGPQGSHVISGVAPVTPTDEYVRIALSIQL